jgi:hypothetical protein
MMERRLSFPMCALLVRFFIMCALVFHMRPVFVVGAYGVRGTGRQLPIIDGIGTEPLLCRYDVEVVLGRPERLRLPHLLVVA